jgi:hypothetical protein
MTEVTKLDTDFQTFLSKLADLPKHQREATIEYMKALNQGDAAAAEPLPDDPRECCRAIITQCDRVDDWPKTTLPVDFIRLVDEVLSAQNIDLDRARAGLLAFADTALDAAEVYRDIVRKARELAVHGSGRFDA